MAKKKKAAPKPRGVWTINPKSRVKPSKKIYSRKSKASWEEEDV